MDNGTTVVFSLGNETYEYGYTEDDIVDILAALRRQDFVRCDSDLGEVFVSPLSVQFIQSGRRKPRRTTAAATANSDHQRLVGGQSL